MVLQIYGCPMALELTEQIASKQSHLSDHTLVRRNIKGDKKIIDSVTELNGDTTTPTSVKEQADTEHSQRRRTKGQSPSRAEMREAQRPLHVNIPGPPDLDVLPTTFSLNSPSTSAGFQFPPPVNPPPSGPHYPQAFQQPYAGYGEHSRHLFDRFSSASAHRICISTGTPSPAPTWSPSQQENFENRILRLTASAGFPLNWVNNPEWILFCEEFLPSARNPSRKTLTRRLLPAAVRKLRAEAQLRTPGSFATIQEDGWTGNKHNLMAFMMTAEGQVID
ncbi:hypothetical protein B0H14DRAFT_2585150 [Mycena olivaceomarginata]|nr:hypothetical protein B0H14DRAFT_2585150 [Mycena olivaceomarginata]